MGQKLLLLFAFLFFLMVPAKVVHPYHVGSVELSYNQKSETFEITGKFFLDDLENGLTKKFGTNHRFLEKGSQAKINLALAEYFAEYLKLKINGKQVKINFIGYEEESEAVNVYLETERLPAPKKVEVSVSVLYQLFDDQINIVHIVVNGKRESHKLSYPDRYFYRIF